MKKAKVLSILLAAIMIFTMLPQCVLAAEVTAVELDAALGNLADKGQKYVTAGELDTTVNLEDETYTVTYTSTNEGVITSNGKVNNSYGVEFVTVTPQITVNGIVVQGTAQSLIVLPDASLAKATFFEDFEGESFAPATGTSTKVLEANKSYGGWNVDPYNENASITIEEDKELSRFLHLHVENAGSTNGTHYAPTVNTSIDGDIASSDIVVFSANVRTKLESSGTTLAFRPFFTCYSSRATDKKYTFYITNKNEATVNPYVFNDSWYNFTAVRIKGATSEKTATTIFIDGSSAGTFYGEAGATELEKLVISLGRAAKHSARIDDIYVAGMELPKVKLGDIGKLVTSDALPTTASGHSITYECSNPDVISSNGAVTRGLTPQFVTVTPKINIHGTVIAMETQNVTVMPMGSVTLNEDFEGNAFKPEAGASEKIFASTDSPNGWTINTKSGDTAKAVVDTDGNRYFSVKVDDVNNSSGPSISKALATPETGLSVVAFRAYVEIVNSYTPKFRFSPFVEFRSKTSSSTLDVLSGGTSEKNVTQKAWHDFVLVRKNVGNLENTVTDIYIDNAYFDTLVGDAKLDKTKLSISINKGNDKGNTYYIDDIVVMNYDYKLAEPSDYIVTSVNLTDSALTGCTILSTKKTPVESMACTALYDGEGRLTRAFCVDVNGDTTVSDISLQFGEAEKLKIFVWSKTGLQPLSCVYEKTLVAAES